MSCCSRPALPTSRCCLIAWKRTPPASRPLGAHVKGTRSTKIFLELNRVSHLSSSLSNTFLAAALGVLTLAAVPASARELCGIGSMRGPYGNCVPKGAVVAPAVAAPVVVAPAPVVAPAAVVAPGAVYRGGAYGAEGYRGAYGGAAVSGPNGGGAVRGPNGAAAVSGPNGGAAARGPAGNTYVRR